MDMIGKHSLLIAMTSLATLMFGVGSSSAEPHKVRYAAFPCTHCAPGWLMQEFGKKHNLDIEIIPMRRYADIQLGLATDQIDFGNFGFINIPLMANTGITPEEVKLVAGVSDGAMGLIIRKGVAVEGWSGLEGKKIGSSPNSLIENLFKAAMRHFDADPTKVEWVSFTTMGPEVQQALKNGDIDGFVGWEPAMAAAVVAGDGEYSDLPLGDNPAGLINGALGAAGKFIRENPEAAEAVVRTHVEVVDYLNGNPEEWVALAMRVTGGDADTTKLGVERSTLHYLLPQAQTEELARLLFEAGLTQQDFSAKVHEYLDYSLLEAATGKSASELGSK